MSSVLFHFTVCVAKTVKCFSYSIMSLKMGSLFKLELALRSGVAFTARPSISKVLLKC